MTLHAPVTPIGANGLSRDELKEMLAAVNYERANKGELPVCYVQALNNAAQSHSEDMFNKKKLSHYGSRSSDAYSFSDRYKKEGYTSMSGSENIARGPNTVQVAMYEWIKSSGHYANLINEKSNHFGVGKYGDYWTQNFGEGDESLCVTL